MRAIAPLSRSRPPRTRAQLSIAMREINEGLLTVEDIDPEASADTKPQA
jgi:hypothetical protein